MNNRSVFLIMHNIRSALNVGAMFRTADAAGIARVYVCGYTPRPDGEKVAKTALGAQETVAWEQHRQTWRLLAQLKKEGVRIIALEQASRSKDIFKYKSRFPLALIVGNEVSGLSPAILKLCDDIVEIPMRGKKESLNVSVAAGIALYAIIK